jgi:hypothetical protein
VTAGRRTLALATAAVLAVAAAVGVTISKRHTNPRHAAVAQYIERINAVQDDMRGELTVSAVAYRRFATDGRIDARGRAKLVAARGALERLERRLAAIPAPRETTHLRVLVRRLAADETALAGEVAALATFAPQFGSLLAKAAAAGTRLERALAAVESPTAHPVRGTKKAVAAAQARFKAAAGAAAAAQAQAIEDYADALGRIAGRIRALHPPPVLEPAYRTQLKTFTATRQAGDALAGELRSQDRTEVSRLGRTFMVAARSAGTVGAQRAQIAAIREYNRRVRALGKLRAQIRDELARVQLAVQ